MKKRAGEEKEAVRSHGLIPMNPPISVSPFPNHRPKVQMGTGREDAKAKPHPSSRARLFQRNSNKGKSNQTITVRLLRSWEVRNFKLNGALMSFDLLLLDEKDTLIQASIYHRRIERFKNQLNDGNLYLLSHFKVVPAYSHYKITDSPLLIRFTDATEVVEVPDEAVPPIKEEKFRLRTYSEMKSLADTNLQLLDIVGQIIHVQGSNLEDSNSTQKIVIVLLLQSGTTIRTTLWDNQASAFRSLFRNTERKCSVIVITSLNPKKFAGKLQLSSSGSTKFYIDYGLGVVKNFMSRVGIKDRSIEAIVDEDKKQSNKLETWTIPHLLDFISAGNQQDKEVICQAKIIDISDRNGWNYLSCAKCSKKLSRTDSSLKCNVCNESDTIGVLRFRVEIQVQGGDGQTKFVLFDKDVRKLTNTTAEEITASQFDIPKPEKKEEIHTPDYIPECLRWLIGKTMDFQVKITKYNFRTSFQAFTVSRVLNETPGQASTSTNPKIKDAPTKQEEENVIDESLDINKIKKGADFPHFEDGAGHHAKKQRKK